MILFRYYFGCTYHTHILKIVQNCNVSRRISISSRIFVFKTFDLNGISVYRKRILEDFKSYLVLVIQRFCHSVSSGKGRFSISRRAVRRDRTRRDFAIIYLLQGSSSRRVGESRAVRDVRLYLCSRRKRK